MNLIETINAQYELCKNLGEFSVQNWMDRGEKTFTADDEYLQRMVVEEPLPFTGEEWKFVFNLARSFGHGWATNEVGDFISQNLNRPIFGIELFKVACDSGLDSIGRAPTASDSTATGRTSWRLYRGNHHRYRVEHTIFEVEISRPHTRVFRLTNRAEWQTETSPYCEVRRWDIAVLSDDFEERHILALLDAISASVSDTEEKESLELRVLQEAVKNGLSLTALLPCLYKHGVLGCKVRVFGLNDEFDPKTNRFESKPVLMADLAQDTTSQNEVVLKLLQVGLVLGVKFISESTVEVFDEIV